MKKFFIFVFISIFFSLNCFAIGAGVRIAAAPSFNIDISGSNAPVSSTFSTNIIGNIRLFRIPAQFGFGFQVNQDDDFFDYGILGDFDYIMWDKDVTHNFSIYTGTGINGAVLFNSNKEVIIHSGTRFFFGYNWFWRDNYMELFTQLNLNPLVEFRDFSVKTLKINFPIETGFRLHF